MEKKMLSRPMSTNSLFFLRENKLFCSYFSDLWLY